MSAHKLIINFCPTGMVPTKQDTPYVPISPSEIIEQVHEAWEIGITIAHLHARNAAGKPDWRPEAHVEMVEGIRKHCPGLVICLSTSGRDVAEFEKRSAIIELQPDMASLTLGSINFLTQASINAPEMITRLFEKMLDFHVLPEFECFNLGMINFGKYLKAKYNIPNPAYWNLLFGNISGFQPDFLEMGTALARIDSNDLVTIGGLGSFQLTANSMAIAAGQGVRVGLEDNIYFDSHKKYLASNKALVQRIHDLLKLNGKQWMQPLEFRELAVLPLTSSTQLV